MITNEYNKGRVNDSTAHGCPKGRGMIDAYRRAVIEADLVAPRVAVREGEAVLIDNYRM